MSFSVISGALASAVGPAGTFAVSFPSGKDAGNFYLALNHKLTVNGDAYFFPVDFDVTLGTTTITVTNKSSTTTWPQAATFRLQMEELGERSYLDYPLQFPNSATNTIGGSSYSINVDPKLVPSTADCYASLITLGAPIAADDDGICAAQSLAAAGSLTMAGALVSGGVATLDQPRGIQIVSSNTDAAVLTVTGTDVYGRPMSEAITLNATTVVFGKKAFKTVTSVVSSAAIANLAKVGTSNVLGLPVFLPDIGFVVSELVNGKPVGPGGTVQIPFFISAGDLSSAVAQELISPVSGFISRLSTIVQVAITTGGNIKAQVGTTDVTGLSIDVADSATAGTVQSDTPTTPASSTTVVTVGSRIRVVPGSTFATAGAVNGFVEIQGTNGAIVPGIRTGGGSTTTTGDPRGTYTPFTAPDGVNVYQLVCAIPSRWAGIAQNVSGA